MAALIVSPVVAVTALSVTHSEATRSLATAPARTVARLQGGVTPLVVSELREPQTDAPSAIPAPAAPPAPPPAAARLVARAAPPAPPVKRVVAPKPVTKPVARPRPAPTPVPVAAPPASPTSIIGIIEAAAARWGVSGSWMVSIARCESGLRPTAVNPSGPYIGLFQFLQSTFAANGGTNIWSAADQANIAAKMLAHGQAHQWSCA